MTVDWTQKTRGNCSLKQYVKDRPATADIHARIPLERSQPEREHQFY